jgi:hypothetical protein
MDEAQKPYNSDCYTRSSEPFEYILNIFIVLSNLLVQKGLDFSNFYVYITFIMKFFTLLHVVHNFVSQQTIPVDTHPCGDSFEIDLSAVFFLAYAWEICERFLLWKSHFSKLGAISLSTT